MTLSQFARALPSHHKLASFAKRPHSASKRALARCFSLAGASARARARRETEGWTHPHWYHENVRARPALSRSCASWTSSDSTVVRLRRMRRTCE
jgi:hypothetical protein